MIRSFFDAYPDPLAPPTEILLSSFSMHILTPLLHHRKFLTCVRLPLITTLSFLLQHLKCPWPLHALGYVLGCVPGYGPSLQLISLPQYSGRPEASNCIFLSNHTPPSINSYITQQHTQHYPRSSLEGMLVPWEPGKINIATSPPLRSRRISPFIL